MRLSFYSDYSLRLLMYLAIRQDALVTIQEVADAYRISKNHLTKVAYDLGRAGFLETVRGRNGGIHLAKCFDAKTDKCVISGPCRLKGVLASARQAYFDVLDQYTLAHLTGKNPALSRLLEPV